MTLYQEIAERIRERIANGTYPPGKRIPSIRCLAETLGCNKLTVQKAFERLIADGLLETIVGSGTYVTYPAAIPVAGEVFDLSTDYFADAFFPHEKAARIFQEIFIRDGPSAFSATPIAGDPGLIESLGRFYRLPTRRVMVVSGAQQGLGLAAKVFSARIPETILFEYPTYPGAISLFKARHFIGLDGDGPKIEELENRIAEGIRFFYTMPAVHNPTGIAYTTTRREAVARLAAAHGVYIIEDDYQSEFVADPTPRFVDIAPEHTVYVKSLSQATVAGLRLGVMVVPEALFDRFIHAKYTSGIGSNGLMQKFFDRFVRDGDYRRFLDETTARMADRRDRLRALLAQRPFLTVPPGQNGGSLWVKSSIVPDLPHVPWVPGRLFSFSPAMENYFRISFMALNDIDFEPALAYMAQILDRFKS